MIIHPARAMPFAELTAGLTAANDNGHVSVKVDDDLSLYTYTKQCVYDRAWNPITTLARGLVLDHANDNIVATPFPKFFNLGERAEPIPDLPFETFEKVDGSLIIIFWHAGQWRTATKGSFDSEQARWAAEWLASHRVDRLVPGNTYLAEYVGPDNKIVVHYDRSELVLLAIYDRRGKEMSADSVIVAAADLGWRVASRYHHESIAQLIELADMLSANAEGFVIRFSNGERLKIKGDEYCRLHRLISNITPLAIWDALRAGTDTDEMRRELPEEFWQDFDSIVGMLWFAITTVETNVAEYALQFAHLTDKEVGLQLYMLPADVRAFIFPYRRHGGFGGLLANPKSRDALFRLVRPTRNELPGYTPSRGMNRVMAEAA